MPVGSRSRSESRRRSRRPSFRSGPSELKRVARAGERFDIHLHLSRYWPDPAVNRYGPEIDFSLPGLLSELDAEGIGHGLVLQLNDAPSVSANLREGQEIHLASHGRLLRSSTLDPTRGPRAISDALESWEKLDDLSALKLYPGYQHFYPHDRVLDPVYEFAGRRGLVVMVHQGDTLDPRGLIKFSRPLEMDEVAVRFREVRFVLCHLGNPWIEEAAEIVYKNPNVFTDTSGLLWSPTLPRFPALVQRARTRLQDAISEVGDVSKFLYGSDWPLESIRVAVRLIDSLDLTRSEKEAILGGNARRLFRHT